MKTFNAIIGVLAIFGMFYCILWPDSSFLDTGWIVAFVLLLWGICSIITSIIDKKQGFKDTENAAYGTIGLILGIVITVFSIVALFVPEASALLLLITMIVFLLFLLVAGIRNIIFAIKAKSRYLRKRDRRSRLVLGIVQLCLLILGIVGWCVNPGAANIFIGIMLGVFGCTLIASIFIREKIDRFSKM